MEKTATKTIAPFPPVATRAQRMPSATSTQLLSNLSPEKKLPEARKLHVQKNEVLEMLLQAFIKSLQEVDEDFPSFTYAAEELKDSGYTAHDILELSRRMAGLQHFEWFDTASGLFLSGLIRQSNETKFTISTKGWEVLPDKIGYKCSGKRIKVIGSVGYKAAQGMESGTLEISGDAGEALAHHMEGGIVIVRGNVGKNLGHHIEDGDSQIKVYGEVESVSVDVVCHNENATPKVYAPRYVASHGWGGGSRTTTI